MPVVHRFPLSFNAPDRQMFLQFWVEDTTDHSEILCNSCWMFSRDYHAYVLHDEEDVRVLSWDKLYPVWKIVANRHAATWEEPLAKESLMPSTSNMFVYNTWPPATTAGVVDSERKPLSKIASSWAPYCWSTPNRLNFFYCWAWTGYLRFLTIIRKVGGSSTLDFWAELELKFLDHQSPKWKSSHNASIVSSMRSNYYVRARFVVVPWLVLMQVLSALVTQNQKKQRSKLCLTALEDCAICQRKINRTSSFCNGHAICNAQNNNSSLRNSY